MAYNVFESLSITKYLNICRHRLYLNLLFIPLSPSWSYRLDQHIIIDQKTKERKRNPFIRFKERRNPSRREKVLFDHHLIRGNLHLMPRELEPKKKYLCNSNVAHISRESLHVLSEELTKSDTKICLIVNQIRPLRAMSCMNFFSSLRRYFRKKRGHTWPVFFPPGLHPSSRYLLLLRPV
jgi:hypothetical protein